MYRNGWVANGLVSLLAIVGFGGCNSSKTATTPPAAAQSPAPSSSSSSSATFAAPQSPQDKKPASPTAPQSIATEEEQSRELANDLFAPQRAAPPADSPFNNSEGLGPGGVANPFESLANAFGAVGQAIAGDSSDAAESNDGQGTFTGSLRKALRKGLVESGSDSARTAQRDDSQPAN